MRRSVLAGSVFLIALSGLLVACGDDDGAGVRGCEEGSSSGGSASGGSASGGSASGGSGSEECEEEDSSEGEEGEEAMSHDASGPAECTPVGEELAGEADETVEIELLDFAFAPAELEVDAGVVTFSAENGGEHPHELALLPGGGEVPFVEPGVADEDALAEAGAFELEAFAAGTSCEATFELEPGEYTLFCLVPDEGETHYEKGMAGELTVA